MAAHPHDFGTPSFDRRASDAAVDDRPGSSNGNGASPPATGAHRVLEERARIFPVEHERSGGDAAAARASTPPPPDAGRHAETAPESPARADGVYAVTKSTDYWFDLEVHSLEKYAREEAVRWAERGLPRHDVKMDGPLPIESALAARAIEIFQQWAVRVQVKMKDAVVSRAQDVRGNVSAFRAHLDALRETRAELRRAMRDRDELRRESRKEPTSIGYGRLLGNFWFWCLMVLLVAVDFVANVPVFRELLPPDALADRMYRQLATDAEAYGLWSGLYRIWAQIATYPDASILAAGVIILLVFLGDRIGVGARTLFAFRTSDAPALAQGMRRHRRQSWLPLIVSVMGAAAVIAVLFLSRERILDKAEERLAADTVRVDALSRDLVAAEAVRDMQAIGETTRELAEARAVMRAHEERVAYAATIQAMNVPILLLNISLLLAAAVAGYTSHRDRLGDSRGPDARLLPMDARVDALRLEALQRRERLWATARDADGGLTSLHHLLRARPLQQWEGRAERLRRIVEVFRAENASHRRLDPSSILAFREPVPVAFRALDAEAALVDAPDDLPVLEAEYARLRLELEQMSPEAELEASHAA